MAKLSLTDVSAGYVLVATYNANNALIEAALENTLSRDGTTPNTMSAALDMNSQFITNLPTPTASSHAATKGYVDGIAFPSGGSGDFDPDAVITFSNTITFSGAVDSTGAATFENLIVQEPGGGDTVTVTLDGTDLNMVAAGITDWNFDGGTNSLFNFTVNTNLRFSIGAAVGVKMGTVLQVWDTANDDNVYLSHSDTYATLGTAGTDTGQVPLRMVVDSVLLKEIAAAVADVAGYGQFWVKSDAPNVPYFTDDAGNDQNLDPSVSPINGITADYTMVYGDKGKTIRFTGSTAAQTITIPANASVAYPLGTMIGIENDGTVSVTLAITTDTLTWSKDNTTGSRTLGAGASAVIKKVSSTGWKIAGSALVT